MTEITLGRFIDEMEKNGYEHVFGFTAKVVYDDNHEPQIGACALGQAYLNLFGGEVKEHDAIINGSESVYKNRWVEIKYPVEFRENILGSQVASKVIRWNDVLHYTIEKIVSQLREEYKDDLNEVIITF